MISIPETIPTPTFVTQDEAHLLDSKPRIKRPLFPKSKEQLKREKELIDYKKELFDQNLKRALTPQAKEDEIQAFREQFRKYHSDKNTERFLKRDNDAATIIQGAIKNRNAKAKG